MCRALLALGVGSLAAGVAQAQGPTPVRVTMPTKDAGIYHVATGTWTRSHGATANLGPDVIYRADVPSGYFGVGWEGTQGVDEMILPTPANTEHPGLQEFYRIDGFEFAYCSSSAGLVDWEFVFYDSYVPCDNPDDPANCIHPVAAFALAGLPTGACWTVTVDLSGGFEFCMQGDGGPCNPGYQGAASGLDHAGWGATWHTSDGGWAGPMFDGHNKPWYPEGDGTCYSPAFNNPCGLPVASGLGARDLFGIGEGFGPGCYWTDLCADVTGPCDGVMNAPCAQFHMILYTDCGTPCDPDCSDGVFCDANPANAAGVFVDTCTCTQLGIDVTLSNAPPGQFTYLLVGQGTAAITDPPGAVGDLCLGGASIGRYVQDVGAIDAAGTFSTDILNAVSGGGGGDIPTIGGNLCTPAGQTWRFQYWHRGGGANPSRFSKGIEVTFN